MATSTLSGPMEVAVSPIPTVLRANTALAGPTADLSPLAKAGLLAALGKSSPPSFLLSTYLQYTMLETSTFPVLSIPPEMLISLSTGGPLAPSSNITSWKAMAPTTQLAA